MLVRSCLALIFLLGGCALLSQAQDPAETKTPERCTLAGSVVNSATGAGIGRALVSYSGPASGYRFTDASGSFHVEDVPEGSYSLTISKPGFISERETGPPPWTNPMPAMDPEPNQSALKPVTEQLELKRDSAPARIPLLPVSSIAGTVLDDNNDPIEGVSVQGIAVKPSLGGSGYSITQTSRTDDRGHYQLLNFSPGDYLVRLAGEASSTHYFSGSTLNLNNNHLGIQPVYYPNGDSTASALPLHLAPGERASADFQQTPEKAFDVSGRLTGFVPQAWTRLRIYREGDQLALGVGYVNVSSGQFRLVDLPRGRYTLVVVQYQADPPKWLSAEVALNVTAEPIRDLVVDLKSGVEIPVTVSYEAGAAPDGLVMLSMIGLHSRQTLQSVMLGKLPKPSGRVYYKYQPQSPPEDNATPQPTAFTNVIPDRYRLTIMPLGKDYVDSVKFGELEISHGDFPAGGIAGEIHVTIKGDSATREGQVTAQGQPVEGVQVFLIPPSGDRARLRFGTSDEDGKFQIPAIPPGEYRVRAWHHIPTLKDLLSDGGETVTLQPNEHRTLTVEAPADTPDHQ